MSTLLAFLGALALLIAVHEYGHYRVAVACGVKVLRFSIGFGRVLVSRQRGETEFTLCALPLGGYVRMLDTRQDLVSDAERHRAFDQRPLWQRSAVVAAGPAANLLLAVLLYASLNWIGVQEPAARVGTPAAGSLAERAGVVAGDRVLAVSLEGSAEEPVRSMNDLRWRLTRAALVREPLVLAVGDGDGRHERRIDLRLDELQAREADASLMQRIGLGAPFGEPLLGRLTPDGPADRAGLREGDRVLRLDGRPIGDAAAVRQAIRASLRDGAPVPMSWTVQRQGRVLEVGVTPELRTEGGVGLARIDAAIGSAPEMVEVRLGPLDGLVEAARRTWDISALSLRMMTRMLVGEASLKNLSGPISIADYAGQSARLGVLQYIGFLAVVSVSLGVLNLLPLPMLDGGHLMYHLFEGLTGRPVPDEWLDRLQRGGFAIMLMMISLALYNDVARLMGLH